MGEGKYRIEVSREQVQMQIHENCVGDITISDEESNDQKDNTIQFESNSYRQYNSDDLRKIADLMDKHNKVIRAAYNQGTYYYLTTAVKGRKKK